MLIKVLIIANFLLLKHVFQLEHLHAEDLSFFCNPPHKPFMLLLSFTSSQNIFS